MWSQYLSTRAKDGVVAIFHELHPEPVYCTLLEWNNLKEKGVGREDLIIDLMNKKLIIDNIVVDQHEFMEADKMLNEKFCQTTILYLMTAQGCNFGCGYCPIPGLAKKIGNNLLSTKDAIAGIDLWLEHIKESYRFDLEYYIIFYGGEPLLNKDVIKKSLENIDSMVSKKKMPDNINIMIATNGSLIDQGIIDLCQKYNISVAVGLDGTKEINDSLRIDTQGNGTYDFIVDAINSLIKNNIKTLASVSITPYNIDHLSEYSKFFVGLGVDKFGFNFLKGHLLEKLVGKNNLEEYYRKASRGIINNSKNQSRLDFEYQMEKKIAAYYEHKYFPVDCTCYGNQLVIQPDGQISNCPFYNAGFGLVQDIPDNFRIWKQPFVEKLKQRLPLYHPGSAKAINGGGCAWSCHELNGDVFSIDQLNTIFSEEVLNEFIWSSYKTD